MKRLGTRVNLIPVIAKADTMSPTDLEEMKDRVRTTLVAQGIKVYVPPVEVDDQASADHSRTLIVSHRSVQGGWAKVVECAF
jgi:cell division control protein 12